MIKEFEYSNISSNLEIKPIWISGGGACFHLNVEGTGTFDLEIAYSNDKINFATDSDLTQTGIDETSSPIVIDLVTKAIWVKFTFKNLTGTLSLIEGYRGR